MIDKSSVPPMLLVLTTRECFTSMKEVDCSKLINETESDDILKKSNSSFWDDKDEWLNSSFWDDGDDEDEWLKLIVNWTIQMLIVNCN